MGDSRARNAREASRDWRAFTADLAHRLDQALAEVRARLHVSEDRLAFRSGAGTWSNLEIGEHVVLVNHYLLILADKIARKSLARCEHEDRPCASPPRLDPLEKLASRDFKWSSPEHMIPTGTRTASEIEARLGAQLERCLGLIASVPDGEGSLHRIRMSVVGGEDDRLDLYQFLFVIALHAQRHAQAMRRNEEASIRHAPP